MNSSPINILRKSFISRTSLRKMTTKLKVSASLSQSLHDEIENDVIKPRKHPGRIKTDSEVLPNEILKSLREVVGDTPVKKLLADGKHLYNYLRCRHAPIELQELLEKKSNFVDEVKNSINFDKENASEEELKYYNSVVQNQVNSMISKRIYHWKPVPYSRHMGLSYALVMGPPEYTVLHRIFSELIKFSSFIPKTIFDFGSGVGTVRWAAQSAWDENIEEYYCVDACGEMNDLASDILQKAHWDTSRTFYRQFLPASHERKYDLVVSAYSLLELPSAASRLEIIANLWNKTEGILVLVENGSLASFKILNEARDFLLSSSENMSKSETKNIKIVAPCPHDMKCPRSDGTPCNFSVRYQSFQSKTPESNELFSYLVLAKGDRLEASHWPRIVRPVLLRSGHVICQLCTDQGKLEQVTITKCKPNRPTYRCAKASKWGDLLPVTLSSYLSTSKFEKS